MSKHTELHHLIPRCIEIEEFECAGISLLPAEEDESFSISHLHHLQASFNSKVTDMKEAADLLSEYTKKVTVTVTVKDVANTTAPPPPVLPVSTTSPTSTLLVCSGWFDVVAFVPHSVVRAIKSTISLSFRKSSSQYVKIYVRIIQFG